LELVRRLRRIEADSGNEDPVEKTPQNRRKTFIPNGINKDERFCRQQSVGIAGDRLAVNLDIMVANSLCTSRWAVET
jgi:hypothetical protein